MTQSLRTVQRGSLPWKLLFLFLLTSGKVLAQSGSVDTYGFTPSTGNFTSLPAFATAVPTILADDAVAPAITLPFVFNFDGTPYNTVIPSSNGFLSFSSGATTTFANDLTGGPAVNRPLAAAFWDDLDGRTTGAAARYNVTGATPNRVFTFQWLNWGRYEAPANPAPTISFQVKLYETTNVVQYIYRQEAGTLNNGSASIGLSGVGSGVGSFLSLSDSSPAPTASSVSETATIAARPATGQIYTFTPPVLTGCPAPRSIALSDVTGSGATLSFRGNANATTYTITVTPQGGPALPVITTATSPVVITGLVPNTTYTVTVVSNCAAGVTSTPATTTFASAGPYCMGISPNPLGGTCGGNNVTLVSLTGTTLNATGLTCANSSGSAYTNYPASGATTATLNGGVPYQLNVTTSGNSIISAWLDSNHNLTFEPTEWVQVAVSSTANQITTVTLFVPATATQGQTGLRIRSRAAGNPNGAPDPCTQFFSGETKDFTVTIGPPAACPTVSDAAAGSVTTTSAAVSFTPLAAATGYTLTVTPQGGAALQPVTATTSPVSLSGLTPNTNYTVTIVSNCGGTAGNSIGASLAFTTLPVPPVNDNCAAATAVPVTTACTTPTTGTVLAASQSQPPTAGCGTTTAANDVWYTFVASGVNHVLAVTGQFAGVAEVRSGTCVASSSVFCTTFTAGAAGSSSIVGGLTIGQTYFIRIYANSATAPTAATSGFTVCVTPGPVPPSNDNCAAATPLPVTTACTTPTSGTVAAASQSLAPTANCGFGITQANDVWYSFVATGSSQALTFAPQFNGVVDVRSGSCTTSASIYCNTATGGAQLIASITGLTSGQTYFLRVYAATATNPAGASAGFTLCLTAGSAAPANDDCAGALDVPVQLTCSSPTTSTNVGASASTGAPAPTCRPNGYAGGDIWFRVTVPTNGTVTVGTVAPTGGSAVADTQMSVYSGTCGALSELNCNDEGPGQVGFSQLTINGRTPGEILYVRVWAYGNTTSGPIALCATTPNAAPCPAPTSLTISNIGSTTATLDFSPSGAATTYTVSLLAQGSTTPIVVTPAPTTSPVQLTGLAPGVAYTVSITSNCAGGINSATGKITFATVTPCPAPGTLVFNNVTATTATLSFATTGAASYTLTLTPATGAPIVQTLTASPVNLTGLTPGATYTVKCVAVCGPNRTSPPTVGTLNTLTSYCVSGLGGACGTNDITAVSITGTSLVTTALTCTSAGGQAYTSYPIGGNTTTNLLPTTTYALNVTTATPSIVSAWIDYNHNLTFEAGEFALVSLATTANVAASVNITIPANAVLGLTSMRIRSRATAQSNGPTDACQNFQTTGETKDFTVTLGAAAPCASVTSLAFNNVSANSVSMSFGLATGASFYTLTLTPATGTPITQTVTTSPHSITGLQPNTVYTVQMVTNCGGGRTSAATNGTFTTLVSSSRAQFESTALLLYPNPVNAGRFTLRLNGNTGKATATLFDMLGRALHTQSFTGSKEQTIDVHQLTTGVYTLRLQTADGQTLTRKVVLE